MPKLFMAIVSPRIVVKVMKYSPGNRIFRKGVVLRKLTVIVLFVCFELLKKPRVCHELSG